MNDQSIDKQEKSTEQKKVFYTNMERVIGLKNLYETQKKKGEKETKEHKFSDILRSAVVFIHSSFEEYFRSILIEWLPYRANSETLKEIPISIKAGKKAEKIYLNDLANYRGKKVDEIIKESVCETMKLKSFNNQEEIRNWCSKIDIYINDFEKFDLIDNAVNRRHKIVHEADMTKDNERIYLSRIDANQVFKWISAYKELVDKIDEVVCQWEEL